MEIYIWEPGSTPVLMSTVMPASVYQLVFSDTNMQKLVPSKLQVGMYMTDTVKIAGYCTLYLIHPDTKRLLETTFNLAMNDGSVLLSWKTTLLLGLIQPRSRRELPPTKTKSHYQYSRSSKENEGSTTCTKAGSVCPKEWAKSGWSNKCSQKTGPQNDNNQRDDTVRILQMSFKELTNSWEPITIYRLIPVYLPNKHLASQFPYTWKKCSGKK